MKKRIIGLFIISIFLISTIGMTYAKAETCPKCGSMAYLTCADDRDYDGSGTHKYGFLWLKTCKWSLYKSRSADVCERCGHISLNGRHNCYEIHQNCGAGKGGNYIICPCQIPTRFPNPPAGSGF